MGVRQNDKNCNRFKVGVSCYNVVFNSSKMIISGYDVSLNSLRMVVSCRDIRVNRAKVVVSNYYGVSCDSSKFLWVAMVSVLMVLW